MENTNEELNAEELLISILSKAEINGFEFKKNSKIKQVTFIGFGRFSIVFEDVENKEFEFHINELFFNHNFAKSFFGDAETCHYCGSKLKGEDWKRGECKSCETPLLEKEDECWQYHLKKMVLSKNVLEYLKNKI
jgi:hypothetical protein